MPDEPINEMEDNITCCVCDGTTAPLFLKDDYWIRACQVCGHQQAQLQPSNDHITRIYDDTYFQGGGAGYDDYLEESQILVRHGERYGKVLSRYMKPGSLLAVGSAAGFILKGLESQGWTCRGTEPNATMAAHARDTLGLQVQTGSWESFYCDESFDLITLLQVIAHFVDPKKAFAKVSEHCRPGGFCLVESWDRTSLTARFFGQHWHEYSPPSVLHWYSMDGLKQLAQPFGFTEVAHGRPQKWLSGSHAKSLLRYKLITMPGGTILDRFVDIVPDRLPIPYPAEDLFWILFQKSS